MARVRSCGILDDIGVLSFAQSSLQNVTTDGLGVSRSPSKRDTHSSTPRICIVVPNDVLNSLSASFCFPRGTDALLGTVRVFFSKVHQSVTTALRLLWRPCTCVPILIHMMFTMSLSCTAKVSSRRRAILCNTGTRGES